MKLSKIEKALKDYVVEVTPATIESGVVDKESKEFTFNIKMSVIIRPRREEE